MKTTLQHTSKLSFLVIAMLIIIGMPACQDQTTSTYIYRTQYPVYLQMNNFRTTQAIIEPGKELENPGKIYIYNDFLLINEPQKGIHVLDNSNPSNPVSINFIKIPGNVDLAVNSNMLYADNYLDLLVFDISDPRNIQQVKRVEDVFESMYTDRSTGTFMTLKDTVLTMDSEVNRGWGWGWGTIFWNRGGMFAMSSDASGGGGESYGQGGSMARFTLMNAHLYAVDEYSLRVFNVENKEHPEYLKNISLGWGIETIFPFQNKLFIGSNTGMHIYDASNPSEPIQMSVYQHVTACDPVVVNETYAFVTLRTGVNCRFGVDELQILNIEDPYSPKLLKSYPMENPHGLGLAGDYLYLAEGKHGLKSFNVADVMNIDKNQLEYLKSMKSVDIIPGPKSLIVIGPDGVCQFDYSTPNKLVQLSCINVKNPIIV
ncbi:hypothetical protein Belba_3750 [Belliella baltica DSM 15883]|uniref:LVIVD repeat protein n=1 Tax=Belliella baltica (strain DSM 15883 / CIP 108006 / LMG 21964 / BA134) TaxID=866536 RepID=I3ZAG5_BELBD|nr:hypothetical protein [Belliella baltica]AFL86233.1 hypothetical protein Belba_3750 [Belliella baltica DSM 15883]